MYIPHSFHTQNGSQRKIQNDSVRYCSLFSQKSRRSKHVKKKTHCIFELEIKIQFINELLVVTRTLTMFVIYSILEYILKLQNV